MRILIIEDNRALAELLSDRLAARGIKSDKAMYLSDASYLMSIGEYDALLLDLGLPDGDGLDWLASLSATRPPVLILTARGTLRERVLGLDTGGDDYLVKPAEAEEIAARLRAIIRRPRKREDQLLTCHDLSMDRVTREVRCGDQPLLLGAKEGSMLEVLMRSCDEVVTRDRLEFAIYGADEAVTPNALEALASRLRRRLSETGTKTMLHAVRGVGYYLGPRTS